MTDPEVEADVQPSNTWQVDKHIPLALLLAIGLQTGAGIWWAATTNSRIDYLERQIIPVIPQGERLIKLETKFDSVIDAINEIKAILRQQRPPT